MNPEELSPEELSPEAFNTKALDANGSASAAVNIKSLPESMWQIKPWWCQPWSIILTGVMIPFCSWLLFHRLLLTLPIVAVVMGWWVLFLAIVPMQYSAAVREAKTNQSEL